MRRLLVILVFSLGLAGVTAYPGCGDRITGSVLQNQPPDTRIWVDTLGVTQSSRVRLFWSGDDPDGFVMGYFVTVDSVWSFTTSQDSTFLIPLGGLDTLLARFRVAAVDDAGNGQWDGQVMAGAILFGKEPFTDLNQNGSYDTGEPFIDLGLVDPSPQELSIRIKNTPPTIGFVARTAIPAVTLPVASFLLEGRDIDGNETIDSYWVSLNQPDPTAPGWVRLTSSSTLLTLVGDLSVGGDTVAARIYSGSDLSDSGIDVPGMRLGMQNVLYVYCVDVSGARSDVARMPDTSSSWTVRKPVAGRRLLLVDDFGGGSPDPLSVYSTALAAADDGKGSTYADVEVLRLVSNPIPTAIHRPMLIATFGLYRSVFWFAKIANINFAQNTLPEYLRSGGKVLFVTGFQNFIDPQGLAIDFMPIDSLVTSYTDALGTTRFGYIPRVYLNSVVNAVDTAAFPSMVFDRTAIFGTYAVVEAPGQEVVYRLDGAKNPPNTQEIWTGTPAVGVLSAQKNIMIVTVPLHLMNTTDGSGRNRLVRFMERAFRNTFAL